MPIIRDISPVFVQARDSIESVLDRYGFRINQEVFDHGAFGSSHVEYSNRAHWLRLNWDGKDAYLWLSAAISRDQHSFPGSAAWKPLDQPTARQGPAARLSPGPLVDARIRELLDQIELFRASKAAV